MVRYSCSSWRIGHLLSSNHVMKIMASVKKYISVVLFCMLAIVPVWMSPVSLSTPLPAKGRSQSNGNGIENDMDNVSNGLTRTNMTYHILPGNGSLQDNLGNGTSSLPGFVPNDSRSAVCHAQCAAKCEDIRVGDFVTYFLNCMPSISLILDIII